MDDENDQGEQPLDGNEMVERSEGAADALVMDGAGGEPSDGAGKASDDGIPHGATNTSFARFFYNHNPFYLISCMLVIYGCQSLAVSSGDLIEKSLSMTGGIAAYTLLMTIVCVMVVRLAKVWEDSRSIFIVVAICLVAVTTGFDELCMRNQPAAFTFGCTSAALTIIVVESLLWLCSIRLAFWYRLTLYVHFAILTGFPLVLGRAVAQRNDSLANWGSVLFSVAVGLGALLLIPVLRRGKASVADNGTPWSWPLYPLSVFLVLLVLAGIRSHAIWMSFGFFGASTRFEPFLLMPLFVAVLVLVAETGKGQKNKTLEWVAIICTPGLLVLGLANNGLTWLPIQSEIRHLFGSALTATFAVVFLMYVWMTMRGVRHAEFGLPATLLVAGVAAPLPANAMAAGVQSWMFPAAACLILLWMTLRLARKDWLWTAVAGVASTTIAMIGNSYGYQAEGLICASAFAILAMLVIGAHYQSDLAVCLRYLAAGAMSVAVVVILSRSLQVTGSLQVFVAAGISGLALVYGLIVRRRGWLIVATLQGVLFLATLSYQGHRSGRLQRINWPIASGLMCLCVGIAITTGKTGVYRKIAERKSERKPSGFLPGL